MRFTGRSPLSRSPRIRLRRWGSLALVAAVPPLGACGSDEGRRPPSLLMEDGIAVIENHTPKWEDETRWRVGDRPLATIGRVDGFAPELLSRVEGALRLRDGRIVIANGSTQELRFYGRDGRFLHSTGRAGLGPGEFRGLTWLGQCQADSLFAYDFSNARVSVFDEHGSFARSFTLRTSQRGRKPYSLSCHRSGRLAVMAWPARSAGMPAGILFRPPVRMDLQGADGEVVRVLGEVPGEERYRSEGGSGPHPLGRKTVYAVTGDRMYLGTADTYEIGVYGPDGSPRARIRWPAEDLRISPAQLSRFRSNHLAATSPERRAAAERWLRDLQFPDSFPAYSDLLVDSEGHLWVARYLRPDEEAPRWDVFDPDGAWLGTINLPPRFEILQVGSDFVLGRWLDEWDVEHVRIYGLSRGPRGAGRAPGAPS